VRIGKPRGAGEPAGTDDQLDSHSSSWYFYLVDIPGRNRRMRIVDTAVEPVARNRIRVITTIDLEPGDADLDPSGAALGEGPTGDAIPDRIVRCLIDRGPGSVKLADIHGVVGGNPGTVNRQAWTLANNAPDLQHRLRGWVVKADRGRYALSPAARKKLGL
jgi:hypothetical protein